MSNRTLLPRAFLFGADTILALIIAGAVAAISYLAKHYDPSESEDD